LLKAKRKGEPNSKGGDGRHNRRGTKPHQQLANDHRVKTPQSLDRLLYVYELDWAKAKELVGTKASVVGRPGECPFAYRVRHDAGRRAAARLTRHSIEFAAPGAGPVR
jgi:hypothetical protein